MNKLYFVSASETLKISHKDKTGKEYFTYEISVADEVVVAKDEIQAFKLASKQNENYTAEQWHIVKPYSLDELRKLLENPKVIIELGSEH